MSKWSVNYYNQKIEEKILKWPRSLLERYLRVVDLIEVEGPDIGMPFTRSMGNGLFEIRVKANSGIGRAFFCYVVKKKIIVLHSLIKKTQKTPKKELDIARKRLKEVNDYEL